MQNALRGKCALITGGSRGIGRAMAIGLASHGADVAVFLATDEARWVTGQNIGAGGGAF